MFVRVTLFVLALTIVPVASAEAQIFRRWFNPAPPQQTYRPPTAPTTNVYGAQSRPQASPQRYYRLPNGQVITAPAASQNQPVRVPQTSPQTDIARRQSQPASANGSSPQLEGPETRATPNLAASPNATQTPNAGAQPRAYQPQQYRRVTVYNPRTGQRSIRLMPIPATQANVASQTVRSPNVVAGTLTPPATATPTLAIAQSATRVDSQVSPATYNSPDSSVPAITLDGPVAATTVQPEPSIVVPPTEVTATPPRDDGQFSVLDFGGEEASPELEAPAN